MSLCEHISQPPPFEQRRAKEAADKRKRDMELLARAAEDSRRMADAARAKREAAARQAEQEAAASGGVSKKVLMPFSVLLTTGLTLSCMR